MPSFADFDFVPLVLAVFLGGLIGLERELHGRPAGLRTHSLVCICSTMLIMIARAGEVPEDADYIFDPNRMGAGIVTGVGFLGAATVLRSGDLVRGLTTAACVWFVAGLGIVLGNRNYELAIISTLFVLSVLTYFERVTSFIYPTIYRKLEIHAHRDSVHGLVEELTHLLVRERVRVIDFEARTSTSNERHVTVYVSTKRRHEGPLIAELACELPGVREAHWLGLASH